jgi:DNA-binding response OmpR family regulator
MTKILLVEDNEMNRDMLLRRLERKGFEVIVAIDGQEGVNKTKECLPDLVLMDVDLPIINGLEATQQIKANATTKSIPVIALTAHTLVEDRTKALEAGCEDYDTKPIEFTRLLEKMDACLKKDKS